MIKKSPQRESVKITLEGLHSLESLHLGTNSKEIHFSIRDLFSLRYLILKTTGTIDESFIAQISDQMPLIENLYICAKYSHFNLDRLINLKLLAIVGTVNESSFNYELFKTNLRYQLEDLNVVLSNIDDNKLFYGCYFPNLLNFGMRNCNMKCLKKEFINRFPALRKLFLIECKIEEIESDAFSDSKQLYLIDMSQNRIKFIGKDTFSSLNNLEKLDLSENELLTDLDAEFIGARNSVEILLNSDSYSTICTYWIGL